MADIEKAGRCANVMMTRDCVRDLCLNRDDEGTEIRRYTCADVAIREGHREPCEGNHLRAVRNVKVVKARFHELHAYD